MIVPSSATAVTSRSAGIDSGARVSEWYRVAVIGDGSPANTPTPSWVIVDVLPCISVVAPTTVAP